MKTNGINDPESGANKYAPLLGWKIQCVNPSAVLDWGFLALLLLRCSSVRAFVQCFMLAFSTSLLTSPLPLYFLCVMSNMLRAHHCQLVPLLTLTFQTPVAGHRHPCRASEKPTPEQGSGLRVSVSELFMASLVYPYVMASTDPGTLSMAVAHLLQGDRPGRGKTVKLDGERSSALRTFHLGCSMLSCPYIVCRDSLYSINVQQQHSTHLSSSTISHPFLDVDISLLDFHFKSSFNPRATISNPTP